MTGSGVRANPQLTILLYLQRLQMAAIIMIMGLRLISASDRFESRPRQSSMLDYRFYKPMLAAVYIA